MKIRHTSPNVELPRPEDMHHDLFRITLETGEKWAIDLTGAQFGIANPISPWHEVEQCRSRQTTSIVDLGGHASYYLVLSKIPGRATAARNLEILELGILIERKLPGLVKAWRQEWSSLTKCSDASFEQAKYDMKSSFDDHLKTSMKELNSPERSTRREMMTDEMWTILKASPFTRVAWLAKQRQILSRSSSVSL